MSQFDCAADTEEMLIMKSLPSLFITFITFIQVIVKGAQTGVNCSAVTPINVPRDPSLYWGTWYTQASCDKCTAEEENFCAQVSFEPVDASKVTTTNLTYTASFQYGSPEGENSQVFGNMIPLDTESFDPLYRLDVTFGFTTFPNNFWVLTTAGNGNEISAMVMMSCTLEDEDQQLFFMSRKPYFVSPVTFDTLVAQTKRAITNYDDFNMSAVYQEQGWCEYELIETTISTADNCEEDFTSDDRGRLRMAMGFSLVSMILALIITICMIKRDQGLKKESSLSSKSEL